MAQQPNLAKLSAEVIDEYLTAADLCIHHRKSDSGCLGYPATLLLFCTLEALGNYVFPKKPFEILNHPLFDKTYEGRKIENLAAWYRHLLAHAAIIAPGIILTPEPDGEPFDFNGDEPIRLRVVPFYRMVKAAWEAFDRNLLKPETHLRDKHYRATTDQDGSTAMPHASSGAPPIVKPIKI